MADAKILKPTDAEFHLPEAIIQRIQSFLSRKQAASTALLSRSWHNAWLTRPILDFDARDFPTDDQFFEFVTRSMERYSELDLNIENFNLWMNVSDIHSSSLAAELIEKAVRMGSTDFNLEFSPPFSQYHLPKMLFESESLIGLSAVGCRISGVQFTCSPLKSLCLHQVHLRNYLIRYIISNCPLLETLFLSDCEGFREVNVGGMAELKNLRVVRQAKKPITWTIPLVGFEFDDHGFCKLSCLFLERVRIDEMLFCDFSSKFPCVEDLTVRYCDGCVKFDISSHSISYLSLANVKHLEIQLDVPNIRSFKFSGAVIPSLSVVSSSGEWESDIALNCWNELCVSWLLELNEFLTNLSGSKISLGIELLSGTNICRLPKIRDLCRPVVENLTIGVHSLTSQYDVILDGMCWSFQPKIITQCLFECVELNTSGSPLPQYRLASNELVLYLSKKFMNLASSGFSNSNEKTMRWHEPVEVTPEVFEDVHMEWRPLPWKTLFDALKSRAIEMKIRFRLRWVKL